MNMNMKDLLKFIEIESKRLRKYYPNIDEDKIIKIR